MSRILSSIGIVICAAVLIAGTLIGTGRMLGFHIVHKRPDWQLFGCKETYVNDKGEDTGECR